MDEKCDALEGYPNVKMSWWEPIYREIRVDMGFSRIQDEKAAQILSGLLSSLDSPPLPLSVIEQYVRDREVVVCGNASCLDDHIPMIVEMLEGDSKTHRDISVVAADGAAYRLLQRGVLPDLVVTDLDGGWQGLEEVAKKGVPMVVHAHGDNIPLLLEYVPLLSRVFGTTQSTPFDGVYNFGGFTDGDRAAYLAARLGATSLTLAGFNLADTGVSHRKKKKLLWAECLLTELSECIPIHFL
ncbi:MAG: 6-hydroxymethylpterin diphosphokinase MptE-like protein [Methermicoccaceae archaeon]